MKHCLVTVLLALFLTSCAHTRDPMPVQMVQIGDLNLQCEQIKAEYTSNIEAAIAKIEKNKTDDVKDVLLAVFIWPGLVDFKNADGIEGNALIDRCIYLRHIAERKDCLVDNWPALSLIGDIEPLRDRRNGAT